MKKKITLLFFSVFVLNISTNYAQPALEKDYSFVMEIPSTIAMDSSPAHLYTLSDTEGMVVFRAQPDTLHWLYSSAGMEQRGHRMTADIRFAYLFGNDQRLTVLEPTSVLGIYSSTHLPAKPLDAKRIDQNLYIALGDQGLGQLSLTTPAAVDSTVEYVESSELQDETIISLETSSDQLFALSAGQKLFRLSYDDEVLSMARIFDLSEPITRIYFINETLYGSDENGAIYEIDGSGDLSYLGTIDEEVTKIEAWNDWLIIKGISDRLWTSYQNRSPDLWKKDKKAGNYFTISKDNFWLNEYNQISRIITTDHTAKESESINNQELEGTFSLQEISDMTIPNSQPLLIPIQLEKEVPANVVRFTYQSPDINNAEIRGRSFLWQPTSRDMGMHNVKIIATTNGGETDSTNFTIDVRSFNAPPKFSPIRPITIPTNESFTLPINAIDPDGISNDLIRFLGVDMPNGASIDESSGNFTWTPTARQVGKNQFRVIATDQFGAASSVDITINVVENLRGDNSER